MSELRRTPCWSGLLLASSLVLSGGFIYWIANDSAYDKVHDILVEHDRLLMRGKREEAFQLFVDALSLEGEGPLPPIWLPLIRASGDGYSQLGYFIRVIAGDPDREATYLELSRLVDSAPESFQREVKQRFLKDLNEVPGVRREYLAKYRLLSQRAPESRHQTKKAPH